MNLVSEKIEHEISCVDRKVDDLVSAMTVMASLVTSIGVAVEVVRENIAAEFETKVRTLEEKHKAINSFFFVDKMLMIVKTTKTNAQRHT